MKLNTLKFTINVCYTFISTPQPYFKDKSIYEIKRKMYLTLRSKTHVSSIYFLVHFHLTCNKLSENIIRSVYTFKVYYFHKVYFIFYKGSFMATGFTPLFTKVTALCINASTVVLACKQFLICADFSPDSDEATFSLEKAKPWIEESYFS